jgi:hypothetical protein
LEPHFQTSDTPHSRRVLEGQLRECYGRVVYSHKTHEKCADILIQRQGAIKITQIVLSALTASGFILTIVTSEKIVAVIGAVISALLLALSAYTKDYDLGALAQQHKQAAGAIWLIREKYLSLIVDLAMGQKPLEAIQKQRDELSLQLHAVYEGSPSTTFSAYRKAQKALKTQEDMTFSSEELDKLLPPALKHSG